MPCEPEKGSNKGRNKALAFLFEWRESFADELASSADRAASSQTRFVDFAEANLAELERSQLSEQTLIKYRSYLRCIRALEKESAESPGIEIWNATLQEVVDDPTIIQHFYQMLYARDLSVRTVSHYMSFCRLTFSGAISKRIVRENPFHEKQNKPRPVRKRPVNYIEPNDLMRVVSLLSHRDLLDSFASTVMICVNTGMRRAEICGLRWTDVDFDRNVIHVRGSLTKAKKGSPREFTWSVPKNDASVRDIPLSNALRDHLKAKRSEVMIARTELDMQWNPMAYVTGNPITGAYFSPSRVTGMWKDFSELTSVKGVLGSRPKFHDLRHTFAVMATAGGMDIETLARILGHENASMTLDIYSDSLASAKQEAMKGFESYLSRFLPSSEPIDILLISGAKGRS